MEVHPRAHTSVHGRSHEKVSHPDGTLNLGPVILYIFFLSDTSDRHEKSLVSAWCIHELWCP